MRDRILILKPSSLGDIVQTLPALAALRRGLPNAELAWLVNTEWSSLLSENPLLDRLHLFPRQQLRGLGGPLAFAQWLGREPPGWEVNTVLDFQGLLRSGLIARATGAKRIIGLDDSREGARLFHTEVVEAGSNVHSVERYLRLARAIGAADGPVEFPLGPDQALDGFAPPERAYLVLHPFSRGEGKSLALDDAAIFCRAVHPRPVVVVGRGVRPDARWPDNVIDLLDKTSIPHLLWLLRRASATVSVDSGPMHLAAATGRPLISIHAWSDPRKVGPYRADALIWKGTAFCRFDELSTQPAGFFLKHELPCPDDIAAIAKRAVELMDVG